MSERVHPFDPAAAARPDEVLRRAQAERRARVAWKGRLRGAIYNALPTGAVQAPAGHLREFERAHA